MELCDDHDKNKYPIVLVGNKVREEVEDELVRNFEKVDGQKPSLRFFVQINLSKYNSEIYVKSEIFECLFWGKTIATLWISVGKALVAGKLRIRLILPMSLILLSKN